MPNERVSIVSLGYVMAKFSAGWLQYRDRETRQSLLNAPNLDMFVFVNRVKWRHVNECSSFQLLDTVEPKSNPLEFLGAFILYLLRSTAR